MTRLVSGSADPVQDFEFTSARPHSPLHACFRERLLRSIHRNPPRNVDGRGAQGRCGSYCTHTASARVPELLLRFSELRLWNLEAPLVIAVCTDPPGRTCRAWGTPSRKQSGSALRSERGVASFLSPWPATLGRSTGSRPSFRSTINASEPAGIGDRLPVDDPPADLNPTNGTVTQRKEHTAWVF